MSSIFDNANLAITNTDEIPEEYRDEAVEQAQLDADEYFYGNIIPGIRGEATKELTQAFGDDTLFYFGHGTPGDDKVLDSILTTGLNVTNPESFRFYDNHLRGLESTSIGLGYGSETLYDDSKKSLDHWPHKDSKNIVIISLPLDYIIPRMYTGFADSFEQFYIGSDEKGFALRPEFIKGIYNADSQSFIPNKNFYKNLPEELKMKFFMELDNNYIKAYAKNVIVSPEFIESLPVEGDNLQKLYTDWYSVQLRKLYDLNKQQEEAIQSNYEEDDEWKIKPSESVVTSDFDDWVSEWDDEPEDIEEKPKLK